MPPKKDAGPAPVATGPAYTPEQQAERIVLIEECKRLRDIRLQEQADYAQFTEEKEKLNILWAQTKKNLEDTKAEVRQKEREKQELADEQTLEIKVSRILRNSSGDLGKVHHPKRCSLGSSNGIFSFLFL